MSPAPIAMKSANARMRNRLGEFQARFISFTLRNKVFRSSLVYSTKKNPEEVSFLGVRNTGNDLLSHNL